MSNNSERVVATQLVRVSEDLAEMLGGIWFHERVNSAELLDPLIRTAITKRYQNLPAEVRAVLDARRIRLAAESSSNPRVRRTKRA